MTASTVADQAAARREAQARAVEAAIVAAAVAGVAARVDAAVSALRRGAGLAVTAPLQWAALRRRVARDLTRGRVDVAARVARLLPRAARVGAAAVGAALPGGYDPAGSPVAARILAGVDRAVAGQLTVAARDLTSTAPGSVDDLAARVEAVRRVAETAAGDAAAAAVSAGAVAAADAEGLDVVWAAEPGACRACTALDGTTRTRGMWTPAGDVRVAWPEALESGPPLHPHCRCGVTVSTAPRRRRPVRGRGVRDLASSAVRALGAVLRRTRRATDRARGRFARR